ncbi:hypothetical protein D3C71_2158670 [compost metagenome]
MATRKFTRKRRITAATSILGDPEHVMTKRNGLGKCSVTNTTDYTEYVLKSCASLILTRQDFATMMAGLSLIS